MKLNTMDTREYEGNLQGEEIAVGISDIRLIIDRLTDMYADREMACIREYSCNAQDAHIEAGVTAPIEVNTPGPLEPFLTIRDFGIGLALEDIRQIYSQYGASTKRNTNTQTGAFGLGCKSALAYSDQFTVTSTKDGVRIQVVVKRDPAKGIVMQVVDTSDTDEANGTTVMIPARTHHTFEQKAKQFFARWPKGTVKLNGTFPEYMPGVNWVTDTICINKSEGYGNQQSYAVMGGVPYPVTLNHGLGYGKSITAFVPIGSMEIPGNRESVIDSDLTMNTLASVEQAFRQGLHDAIRKDIANSGSHAEAATKKRTWQQQVGSSNMPSDAKYKGVEVPDSYKVEFDIIVAPMYGRKMNAHTSYRKDNYLPLPSVNGCVWVTGFDYVSFTATVKKKLDKWYQDAGMDQPTCYVLSTTTTKPTTTWLENITFIDWPTIKAIKLPKNIRSNVNGRIPGSYDIFESGDLNEDVPADDIDTSNPIFWMIGKYYNGRLAADWLNRRFPGCTLVMMRDGRQDKFQRLFPSAKNAEAAIRDGYKAWVAKIDKRDALAIQMRQSSDSRLDALDESLLDDPAIKKAKEVAGRDTSKLDDEIDNWRRMGYYYSPSEDMDIDNPLDKYPLLPESYYFSRYMRSKADQVYEYMNDRYHRVQGEVPTWRKEQSS